MSTNNRMEGRQRTAKLLALLTKCADAGRPAPTNAELAELLGLQHQNGASAALKRLEALGEVTVERFSNTRIVTIRSTGKSTAGIPGGWKRTCSHRVNADRPARADNQPQGDTARVLTKPEPLSVNRDPCPCCGIRGDIGCRHTRAAQPFLFVPVSLHAAEVSQP